MCITNSKHFVFLEKLQEVKKWYEENVNSSPEEHFPSSLDKMAALIFSVMDEMNAHPFVEEEKIQNFEAICAKYQPHYLEQNLPKLKEELKKEKKLAEREGGCKYSIWVLSFYIRSLDSSFEVNSVFQEEILAYLKSVEQWRIYELTVFSRIYLLLNVEKAGELAKELVERSDFFCLDCKPKSAFTRTLIDVALYCVEQNQLDAAAFLKNCAFRIVDEDERLVVERNALNYVEGYYIAKTGEPERGIQNMKIAVSIFFQLNCMKYADLYGDYLTNFVYQDIKDHSYQEVDFWEEIYEYSVKQMDV